MERANNIVLIGDNYYAPVDGDQPFHDSWRKIAQLDDLPDAIIQAYS
jgi:hypothetical protein